MIPAPGMVEVRLFGDPNAVVQSTDKNYERVGEILQKYGPMTGFDDLEVGDIVFFDEYAYRRFTWEGEDYCILNVSEPGAIWGLIKKQDASTTASDVQEIGISTPIPNDSSPS